jgi:hypothetical protein
MSSALDAETSATEETLEEVLGSTAEAATADAARWMPPFDAAVRPGEDLHVGARSHYRWATSRKAIIMSSKTEDIEAAASELTHAMARLVRAFDAVGDDREAAGSVSEGLVEAIEGLAGRLSAAKGFSA